jgi:Acyl-CoA dehydrogenase, C-terminal domain
MNGEHHFNEVLFDDVMLSDDDVLGDVGNGWHQVTAELGFERSGPERILSTAVLLLDAVRALSAQRDATASTAVAVGDVIARLTSLRQLSISVARALSAGHDAASRAALVKDLGTRFEQDSVEVAAELLDHLDKAPADAQRLRGLLATARVHSPLFTLRGGTNEVLRGVVAKNVGRDAATAPADELSELVDDIGRRSIEGAGHRELPKAFDQQLWSTLEDTGLSRLTTTQGAGLRESAIVLGRLARWAAAVPVAETDVLTAWLAARAELDVPDTGPLTVAIAEAAPSDGRITGTAIDVPWPRSGPVLLAARSRESICVAWLSEPAIVDGLNSAGEPRGHIAFDVAADDVVTLPVAVGDELLRRGAWARCVQIVGALEAATESAAARTRERVQFGRSLDKFHAVAHSPWSTGCGW